MTVTHLQQFLVERQGEGNATTEDAPRIIDALKYRWHRNRFARNHLTLEAFFHYLFSDDLNPAIDSKVHHDMTAPLSHYFIYTGHNSYLTGNQLSSNSSDEPIIRALTCGVRAIELDIWPNSSKDDIVVLHGRTLTSPVQFSKCIKSIKEHAFIASQYPVIITLEDHLTPELQTKAAKMITETFGDVLFYPESEGLEEFPSPESLKGHILISTKPPKEYLETKNSKVQGNRDKEEMKVPEEEQWGEDIPDPEEDVENYEKIACTSGSFEEDLDDDCGASLEKDSVPENRKLITIHTGKKKRDSLKDSLRDDDKYVKRISLSELQLRKIAKTYPDHIVRFTQKNLLRVYPKGTRIDSSNYNPLIAWTHGVQMVALNMQVKVYMGNGWTEDFKKTHFDMYSPPDFYTRIGIAGVPADTKMKKTQIIEDEWTPYWGKEFAFPLTVPELALLRIEVHEYNMSERDEFGGQTCLPVAELKPGIRTIPLYNKKGEKYKAVRLLVRIEFIKAS